MGRCEVFIWLEQAPSTRILPVGANEEVRSEDIDGEFVRLLRHVEATAPVATFPSQNRVANPANMESQGQESRASFQIRSSHGLERNEKVGAAGEYFVSLLAFAS